jgi:hypothetical protein
VRWWTGAGTAVRVELHDGHQLYTAVEGRRRQADTAWWNLLKIHLPTATQHFGRLADEPSPVDFTAPASRCEPIDGQPTTRCPPGRAA